MEVQEGLTVFRFSRWARVSNTPVNPLWPWYLGRAMADNRIDVVNAHTPVPFMAEAAALASKHRPLVVTYHAGSMVKGETLATSNPGSLVDALRIVPGLDITETGGPGRATSVRLRGANPGQTLVLIDGIRANDPTAPGADFDLRYSRRWSKTKEAARQRTPA